jgi:glycopeptide antibiotics resistance protein
VNPTTRIRWSVAAAVVVAGVLLVTLWPTSAEKRTSLVPLGTHAEAIRCLLSGCEGFLSAGRFLVEDVLGNIVLFLPVGAALAGLVRVAPNRRRFWIVLALGGALSLTIEVTQLALPTRSTDVDDLLFNILGTAAGAGLLIWHQGRSDAGPARPPERDGAGSGNPAPPSPETPSAADPEPPATG